MTETIQCPQCQSQRLYKDGVRHRSNVAVQRWLCRSCGLRFSDPKQRLELYSRTSSKMFQNADSAMPISQIGKESLSQVCVFQKAKNLAKSTTEQTVGGVRGKDYETKKGILTQFQAYLDREGYGENCRYVDCIRMLLNSGANIFDPENVKAIIAAKRKRDGTKWRDGTKMQTCYAYDAFTKMEGLVWEMPTYRQEEYDFFLADETELDALINAARSPRMKAYLQILKETFADPTEALRIRWRDVDAHTNTIKINYPVKDHDTRTLEVKPTLITMLNQLPKTSELVFDTTYRNMYSSYKKVRKRVAHDNLHDPDRIESISFVSYRHWGGTMLAWETHGSLLIVKQILGHKNPNSTMKYIKKLKYKLNQGFDTLTAVTDEEIKNCGAMGCEKYDERTVGAIHISYYRIPKRMGSINVIKEDRTGLEA